MKNGNAAIHIDTTVGFLADRQQVIDLAPLEPERREGYVWKRVFLKKEHPRA